MEGVARIALTLGRYRAGIDQGDIRLMRLNAFNAAVARPYLADGLGLVLVDLAAEGDEIKAPGFHGYTREEPRNLMSMIS